MKINHCPKCDSRLWGVERYSAPKKLFYLICSDCQYTEIKEWVYQQNPIQIKK
jgi:hypothetical protein